MGESNPDCEHFLNYFSRFVKSSFSIEDVWRYLCL